MQLQYSISVNYLLLQLQFSISANCLTYAVTVFFRINSVQVSRGRVQTCYLAEQLPPLSSLVGSLWPAQAVQCSRSPITLTSSFASGVDDVPMYTRLGVTSACCCAHLMSCMLQVVMPNHLQCTSRSGVAFVTSSHVSSQRKLSTCTEAPRGFLDEIDASLPWVWQLCLLLRQQVGQRIVEHSRTVQQLGKSSRSSREVGFVLLARPPRATVGEKKLSCRDTSTVGKNSITEKQCFQPYLTTSFVPYSTSHRSACESRAPRRCVFPVSSRHLRT